MKKIIFFFFLLILMAIGAYLYSYKDHRNIAEEEGSYTIAATEIFTEFQLNESKANTKYLDKTIEVTGVLSNIDAATKSIVVNDKLFATIKDGVPINLKLNSKIKIKGRFIGYDALLEELKMDQCSLVTPN